MTKYYFYTLLHNIFLKNRSELLLQHLVTLEQYELCVQAARLCSIDERPYWESWISALIQEGNFESAREKVKNMFTLPLDENMNPSRIKIEAKHSTIRLVRVLETACPIDMTSFVK